MVVNIDKLTVNSDIPYEKKKNGSSLNNIIVDFSLTNDHLGNKNIGFNYEEVNINKNIEVKSNIPNTPQECDYYFETMEDFENRIDAIIKENNRDLINKTFGFSDGVTSLYEAFCNRFIFSTPKMIFARNVNDFSSLFNMSSLRSISSKLFDNCPNATKFNKCFMNCTSLVSIPQGLFDKNTKVTTFEYCFSRCESLTTIPQGLFDNCPKITSFWVCFDGCSSLISIPNGLFDKNVNVENFDDCFCYCKSLSSIPQGLFDNCTKVIRLERCFENCSSITSALPDVWNKEKFPNVVDYYRYAYNCTKAANYAEIPDDFK